METIDDYYAGPIVAAHKGTEKPFVHNGRRWLYCYHPNTGRHIYLDVDRDIAVWNRHFHPVHAPEYEYEPDDLAPKLPTRAAIERAREITVKTPYAW